jgi:uncharacterized protein
VGKLFGNIVSFFNKHVLVYLLVLAGIITFSFFGFKRLKLDENIYSIFPKGEEFQEFNTILQENNLNKQILFSINAKDRDVFDVQDQLNSVAQVVVAQTNGLITDIEVVRENEEENVLNYFYDHFPALIQDADYNEIRSKINSDSIAKGMASVESRLSGANSFFLRKIVARDPLGLAWNKLKSINPQSDSSSMEVEEGILFAGNKSKAIFTAVLNFELDNNVKNEELNVLLEKVQVKLNKKNASLDFDYFGTFQIANENARQVKKDTSITLYVSVGLILLLLILYYRSLITPIYFILPALFSGFVGLGIVGFVHPEISAISIATSAVLLGIVLDYSFHFFTHYIHSRKLIQSVKELSFPMLVGSFTTVAAFTALLFTDSVVLQNFGLIALVTLTSAALFTLLLLPPLLHFTKYKPKERTSKKSFNVPKLVTRIGIFAILGCCVMFLFTANKFQFDGDLNHLSYHTDELVQKEEYFTGINPNEEKKIHLFVSGDSKQEALAANFELYETLEDYRTKHGLEELISVGAYQIPKEVQQERFDKWNSFWKENGDQTISTIQLEAAKLDFSSRAFEPFSDWINSTKISSLENDLFDDLGLSKLIYERNGKWYVITSVVVSCNDLKQLKSNLASLPEVYIFDVSEMANTMMLSVQEDFNYLLIFSSLLVFVSLLVIYGRIELALFSFFPMVISWIFIIGISNYFDIQFNFVNIIVATFIFGLGDDFSIFVTDGLLQQYKTKSKAIGAYRAAIVLSGITTIIGTGALYFAKHPAIHSIAVISVVGISCIMLVTLFVQPSLFRYFVTNRTAKKRSPMTFFGLIYSILLFSYFFIGCVVLNVLLGLLIPIPIESSKKRKVLNYCLSKLAKSTLFLGFHVKKEIRSKEKLDFSNPSIIVPNHSSFLDILTMISLDPKIIIMVKKWVYYSPFFGLFIRYCGYLYIAEGAEYNLKKIKRRVFEGYSIVIFPEGTRSLDGEIRRFHKGAFYLAKEMELDIQPILIVGANYVNPKNDLIIKSGYITAKALDRIKTTDELYQKRFGELTKEVVSIMRKELIVSRQEENTANFLRKRIIYNYIYKGPILEWYIRIKLRFETAHFEYYDTKIGDRKKIVDIGCGYGYLGYYLHYRNPNREIIGIDYDDDKIAVASNGYDKTEMLSFKVNDVRNTRVENADVIFFNDVLHYLKREEQFEVLGNAVKSLNEKGILFIRDGITDDSDRHALTQKTERYSTQIVNFNKTTNQLSFFSSQDIFNFAGQHNLKCQVVEQSKKTSNVLFILEK